VHIFFLEGGGVKRAIFLDFCWWHVKMAEWIGTPHTVIYWRIIITGIKICFLISINNCWLYGWLADKQEINYQYLSDQQCVCQLECLVYMFTYQMYGQSSLHTGFIVFYNPIYLKSIHFLTVPNFHISSIKCYYHVYFNSPQIWYKLILLMTLFFTIHSCNTVYVMLNISMYKCIITLSAWIRQKQIQNTKWHRYPM